MAVANSPKDTYGRFIEFEERAATVYVRLASRFASDNPELAAFWLDMAMEEKQHAALLQFCLAETWFAPHLPGEAEIRKFAAVFRELEKRSADRDLSQDEAFEMACELEGSEVNAIYCHLTTPLHASLYLLKKKIATSPFDHIGHLADAGKKFKVSPATLKQLERLKEDCAKACVKAS
jgi:Rubrerythrin